MITVTGLEKSYGPRDLFRGADLQVYARDRVAIVGPNGSGKTTLIEMIAERREPDGGTITLAKGAVVGYLEQDTDAIRGGTVLEEVLAAGSEATEAGHRLAVLEEDMASLEAGPERDRLIAEYGRLRDRFETLGGYAVESDAQRILAGLGFSEADHSRGTGELSGGWMMRVALARLLFRGPDILMLDEPTNHLDVESVEWLEGFLTDYEGCVLLISHDRDFINTFATKVAEIDEQRMVTYVGNYQDFVRQRAAYVEQQEAKARHQARKIAQTERFIERFRYKASKARQVQSRVKQLEKLERVETSKQRKKKMALRFPDPPRTGRVVLELEGVDFGYTDIPVYRGLDFVVERGQKVALVGPNGAGKSTLLKLLAGVLEPGAGRRRLGHNVELAYFAQHQIEALEPRNMVLQELQRAVPQGVEVKPRDLLGRFLFSGEDVDKPVRVLSGGEKSRLALARLLVSRPSVLCLDEPTNHLDMESRDVLEDALDDYPGGIVLITHDRHLIRQVANRVAEVVDGRVRVFDGDYEMYLRLRDRHPGGEVEVVGPPPATDKPLSPKERRRLAAEARAKTKGLRDRISAIETKLDEIAIDQREIEAILADGSAYRRGEDIASLSRNYDENRKRVAMLEEEWEDLTRRL